MDQVEYTAYRLLFRADIIEPLSENDIIIIHAPDGTFKMSKADFYRVFSNVVKTKSYQEKRIYHYWRTPKKAMEFLVKS